MSVIRIKRSATHAAIEVSKNRLEPSDEVKLQLIAWLVSDVTRKLGVGEIELACEPSEVSDPSE